MNRKLPTIYLDTTVLSYHTILWFLDLEKAKACSRLFRLLDRGIYTAFVSLYGFTELCAIAIDIAKNKNEGYRGARLAIRDLLDHEVLVTLPPSSAERIAYKETLKPLVNEDPRDIPHAIIALRGNVDAIVTYDEHFNSIKHLLKVVKPKELL